MKETIRLIWKCEECEDVVISYSHLIHDINFCGCGKSAVDLDQDSQGITGKVIEISRKKNVNGEWVNINKVKL